MEYQNHVFTIFDNLNGNSFLTEISGKDDEGDDVIWRNSDSTGSSWEHAQNENQILNNLLPPANKVAGR